MSNQENNAAGRLGTAPMGRLVFSMSLPLMVSLLVQSLYNIVDSIFVSRISENALTATSLAYPMQMLMIAIAVGTSVGVNALLSRTIGAKRYDEAGQIATTGLLLSVLSALVFIILGAFFADSFAALFTSDPEIGAMCSQYLFICMLFCPGTFVETMCQRFLQAVGNTFLSMVSLIAGALTNIVLDPILIFGLFGFPALGIRGAAIATVIGQWVGMAVALALHLLKNPMIRLRFRGYRPTAGLVAQIYQVGLPTAVTHALGSVMVSAFNGILMPFSPTAVAFFGVYYKLQNFLFMPMHGLGQAAIPIVGYNYGDKNGARIREVLRTMLPVAVGFALFCTAVFLLIPRQLLGLFSPSGQMLAIGVPALRIISVTFALSAVTILLGYVVSGLGNGVVNMIGTALRQFVIFVPLAYLLARFCGISYVWFSIWAAELIAVCYVIGSTRREFQKKVLPLL
ncbi:MAG: MATE family efflux transporter [Butyricicoccus sp.]